jgi:hypothetical protein
MHGIAIAVICFSFIAMVIYACVALWIILALRHRSWMEFLFDAFIAPAIIIVIFVGEVLDIKIIREIVLGEREGTNDVRNINQSHNRGGDPGVALGMVGNIERPSQAGLRHYLAARTGLEK